MKNWVASTAVVALLVSGAAEAAPKKKSRPRAAATVKKPPQEASRFGVFAKLDGSSWEETATGRIISFGWAIPEERLVLEHDLPTGSREESVLVRDLASGDLLLTHKDKDGKESTTIAQRGADGSIMSTLNDGTSMVRTAYSMGDQGELISETSTLVGTEWLTTDKVVMRRLTADETLERRNEGYRAMMQRWGSLAGLAGKSWKIDSKGRELVQSYNWDIRGSILVERNTMAGNDPAKPFRLAIYRFDDATGKIVASIKEGSKERQSVGTVGEDGTVSFADTGKGGQVTYVRLLGPNYYQTESGKVGKNGFKASEQLTYAHLSNAVLEARAANAAAQQAMALQNAQVASMNAAAASAPTVQATAPAHTLVAAAAPAVEVPVAEPKKKKGGLFGKLMGVAGTMMGAGAIAKVAGSSGLGGLANAVPGLGNLGGLGDVTGMAGMGGADGGLGILGALTGKSGLGIGLASEAIAALGGGNATDAAGLKLMMAAIKMEDPGALMQALAVMQQGQANAAGGAAGGSSNAGSGYVASSSAASGSSKGTVSPGSYPTRPNTLVGQPACSGYSVANYKDRMAANQNGPDVQLHTLCAASFNYYAMYLNAIQQGYSQADSNLTYSAFEKTALTTTEFYRQAKAR